MSITATRPCDVFLSHAVTDSHVAAEIASSLDAVGLETFYPGVVPLGADLGDAIWDAMAECRAFIVVFSTDLSANAMGMVEIGAAAAWKKPVFVIVNGPASTKVPDVLSRYPVYPLSRIEEVVRAIRAGIEPLDAHELGALAEAYQDVNAVADELTQSPEALRELTTRFNKATRRRLSGERLLSELLRMRKSGQFPRLRKTARE